MGAFVNQITNLDATPSSAASALVTEKFDKTSAVAEETYALTKDVLNNLAESLETLTVNQTPKIVIDVPDIQDIPTQNRPSLSQIDTSADWPTLPTFPGLIERTPLPVVSLPTLSATTPSWTLPEKPTQDVIRHPGDAPVIRTDFDMPASPVIDLPSAPSLQALAIPSPPDLELPLLSSSITEFDAQAPEPFNWSESVYNSPIWEGLLTKVYRGLIDGGTGLAPEVEAEIWESANRRQDDENEKFYNEALTYFSARGFNIPPGSLASRHQQASNTILKNKTELNSKLAISQAELAQKNTEFITQRAVELEKILRDFFNSQENRLLDAAKAVAASAVSIYNARVTAYNQTVERYKAEASVFEAQVRAALTKVEIFKAQVEGVRVSSEVQKNLVEIYTRQMQAVNTYVGIYKAQMEGVKVALSVETSKLSAYNTSVQAYVAQIEAMKSKYQMYSLEVEAENSKAKLFSEQVRAYGIEVDAKKAELEYHLKRSEFDTQTNTQNLEVFRSQLAGYTAEIQALSTEINARSLGFRAEVDAYSAETVALGQLYTARSQVNSNNVQVAQLNLSKAIAEIDTLTKTYLAIKEMKIKGLESVMNVGSQLTVGAWNAVNTTASISSQAQRAYQASEQLTNVLQEAHGYTEQ